MKKIITLILALSFMGIFYGQRAFKDAKNTIGIIGSPGYKSANEMIIGLGLRGLHSFNRYLAAGAELNYQQFIGTYGNSDAMGGLLLTRITPFGKGLFAELGIQAYKVVSSARAYIAPVYAPYLSIGYQTRISKRMNMEFQFRPVTLRGSVAEHGFTKTDNIPSKCFIGVNYSF